MKRDLLKDREICNKATPGPWERNEKPSFGDWWVQHGNQHICLLPSDKKGTYFGDMFKVNADFIAQAREGWPEAIERALKAETEVERLRLMVKSITGGLDEAIEIGDYLEAENALLRKVEEVGEIMWSEAVCHKCVAPRACRGCSAHDFKKALSEYQSWKERQELDKEGER